REDADLDRRLAHYRRHGIAEEHTAKMRARGNHYPGLVGALPFHFMPIADGETVVVDGRRWRVITARGHSPEHACLWCEDLRVLIAGDQVLPKITTNVSVWPERPRARHPSIGLRDRRDARPPELPRGRGPRRARARRRRDRALPQALSALLRGSVASGVQY